MARIDVQTLVLAFEKRIESLEKNPPDKVSTAVVIRLLEAAIEDEIKKHFVHLAEKELLKIIKTEFSEMRDEFIKKMLDNLFKDESLRRDLEEKIKQKIIHGFDLTII
jgi:hypothetical protein